jgi:DNA-binding NarL/FixJ family response regulator
MDVLLQQTDLLERQGVKGSVGRRAAIPGLDDSDDTEPASDGPVREGINRGWKVRSGMIRVLSVEDDPVMRSYLVDRLALEPDIEMVSSVPDVTRALICLKTCEIDVVLLDYQLHGTDGEHLARSIFHWKPQPSTGDDHPRLLFCTGFADEAFESKARILGANGVVDKTRLTSDLVDAVRTVASGGRWFGHEIDAASLV